VLYYRALLYGLDPMPPADTDLRAELFEEAGRRGWAALHAELARHDAAAAAKIRPADTQRIQRALEILRLTGKGPSAHHGHNPYPRLEALRLVLTPRDRHILHQRIKERFDEMLSAGLLEEVQRLKARPGLSADHASMKCVGYRQGWEHADQNRSLEDLRRRTVAATRQLAKRQLTGLRRLPGTLWHDSLQERTIAGILRQVGNFFAATQVRSTT